MSPAALATGLLLIASGAMLAFVVALQARVAGEPGRWTPTRGFFRAMGAIEMALGAALIAFHLAGATA
jgi:hypothetical protein